MLHVHDINDFAHPALAPYLAFRKDGEHHRQGLFIAEGAKITERLLTSRLEVISLMLPPDLLEKFRTLIEKCAGDIHAFVAPKPELEKLAGIPMFQGVNSVGRIPIARSLEQILSSSHEPGQPLNPSLSVNPESPSPALRAPSPPPGERDGVRGRPDSPEQTASRESRNLSPTGIEGNQSSNHDSPLEGRIRAEPPERGVYAAETIAGNHGRGHTDDFCTVTPQRTEVRTPVAGRRPKAPSPETPTDRPRLFIATDALTGADNMGVTARNAVAFGADALIVGETCCSPWLRKSVRTSMGAVFQIEILESKSLTETLQLLRATGIRIIAAHAHTNQKTLSECDLRSDVCLVMGAEGHGIRESVLAECDELAIVPMSSNVDSLNVGSAGAVFLYEAARQRGFQNTLNPIRDTDSASK